MIRDLDDKGLGFLLVTSSLSPLPCRLFLVASSLSSHLAYVLVHFVARPVGCPRFRFRGLVGLTLGLAIGDAVSMVGEVAVGLSRWSLWNEVISFLRCWTAEAGSQVFSSSGYPFQETR